MLEEHCYLGGKLVNKKKKKLKLQLVMFCTNYKTSDKAARVTCMKRFQLVVVSGVW